MNVFKYCEGVSKNKTVGANEKPFTDVSEIVICNLETGAQEVVCDDLICFEDYLVFGKFIFYSTGLELKRINIENKAVDILCRVPEFERIQSEEKSWDLPLLRNPCITADGKYISMFAYNGRKNEFGRIIRFVEMFRYSINEGKLVKVFEKAFKEPFWNAGHVMISPTDCNKLFYCHEGNSHYVTNRLWMYDIGKQTDKNIAKQDMDENGCLTECFGHEIWAPDGKPRMSDADQYGQVMIYHETGISAALFANVGTSMIKIDSNDKLTYNMNDPLIVNTVTSIGKIARNGSRYVNDEWRSRVAFFASGKALFMWASITNIPSIVNTAENNGEKCFKNEIVLSCPPHESVSYEIGEKFPEKTVLGAFLNLSFENELNEEVYLCQLPIKAEIETKTEIKKSALIVKEDFCFTAKGENAVFKVSKQTGELISVDYSGEI